MGARVKCAKCGSIIESKSVHDFVWCKCKTIFIDGGNDYFRCGGDEKYIMLERNGEFKLMSEIDEANGEVTQNELPSGKSVVGGEEIATLRAKMSEEIESFAPYAALVMRMCNLSLDGKQSPSTENIAFQFDVMIDKLQDPHEPGVIGGKPEFVVSRGPLRVSIVRKDDGKLAGWMEVVLARTTEL